MSKQLKDNEKIIVCHECGGRGECQKYHNYLNQPKIIEKCSLCKGNGLIKEITVYEAIDKKDLPLYIEDFYV